jgi:hypothetical protein
MIIANPIYDEYFKRLMAHEHIAKFFISTLLKCEVESVQFRPQEFTYVDKASQELKLYRVDFAAVIKMENGKTKKVLIEVQKAHKHTALARFRGYLGGHYQNADPNEKEPLPIITIYILGFNLPDIDIPCFQVGRFYKDMETDKLSDKRSTFMESLTHDSYVVQAERIPEHRGRNPLKELLDLFEQRNFTNAEKTEKNYPYDPEDKGVREMCKVLSGLVLDPEAREEVAKELEYERIIGAGYRGLDNEIAEAKAELTEAKTELTEAKTVIAKKDNVIAKKDNVITKTKTALTKAKKQAADAKKQADDAKAILAAAQARIAELEQAHSTTHKHP